MDFICLPVIFGCSTHLKQVGDPNPRMCPRCNNASVISAKERQVFDLCFIPLIPMKSNLIWHCNICQWQVPHQQGWEPARPGMFSPGGGGPGFAPGWQPPPQQQNWQGSPQPGYQPQYQK